MRILFGSSGVNNTVYVIYDLYFQVVSTKNEMKKLILLQLVQFIYTLIEKQDLSFIRTLLLCIYLSSISYKEIELVIMKRVIS